METIDTGTEELLAQIDQRVATITLNRPDKRNALSDRLTPALRQVLLDLELRQDVGCIVITGAGNSFCAGGDVASMKDDADRQKRATMSLEAKVRDLVHRQETLTLRLYNHAKPTIAAMPGVAAGAGLCLALACDLRLASASTFVTTGYRNMAFSGDYGGSWLLSQLVGPAKTKELYFTGCRVTAADALDLGILNKVVPDEDFSDAVAELATEIANGPSLALGFMKENINRAQRGDLQECLAQEADRLLRCAATADHQEAVAAFLEKRKPRFNRD